MMVNPWPRSPYLVWFVLATLSACGGTAKPGVTAQTALSPAGEADDAAKPTQTALTPSAAVPTRSKLVPLEKMAGLTGTQITDMLGKPQFLRQDNTAELWQYRGESCVLQLFLYRANDEWRVRHAEARPRAVAGEALTDEAAQSCLAKLAAAPPAATS